MNNDLPLIEGLANHPLFKSIWGAIFLASLVTILVLCLLPDIGGEQRFPGQDKVAHGIAFCWLMITGLLGMQKSSSTLALVGLLVGFGLLIEALQYLGGYRSAELLDFIADLAGIGLGIAANFAFNNLGRKGRNTSPQTHQ